MWHAHMISTKICKRRAWTAVWSVMSVIFCMIKSFLCFLSLLLCVFVVRIFIHLIQVVFNSISFLMYFCMFLSVLGLSFIMWCNSLYDITHYCCCIYFRYEQTSMDAWHGCLKVFPVHDATPHVYCYGILFLYHTYVTHCVSSSFPTRPKAGKVNVFQWRNVWYFGCNDWIHNGVAHTPVVTSVIIKVIYDFPSRDEHVLRYSTVTRHSENPGCLQHRC